MSDAEPITISKEQYCNLAEQELHRILQWWTVYMPDKINGGFYGSVNNSNIPDLTADKGLVLNSRILWAFSAAFNHLPSALYLQMATRAYQYIQANFIDKQHGGAYWSLTAKGEVQNDRKQIYGIAFCIYGLSEFYKICRNKEVLSAAISLYECIEQYSLDKERGGYIEAFSRNWSELNDLRLSDKDANERKTMNTHLHILEAYANLYQVWPDEILKEKISNLLHWFDKYFINHQSGHLHLFMDDDWNLRSTLVSFGHDIEAAWLLPYCASVIKDEYYDQLFLKISPVIAHAALRGMDDDGGLWYEYEPADNDWIREKHSWPQAEAMIGFLHAWQISGEDKYFQYSVNSFRFIQQHISDTTHGEWFWGVDAKGLPVDKEKAGFWKCPYHSSRACLEVIKRLQSPSSFSV